MHARDTNSISTRSFSNSSHCITSSTFLAPVFLVFSLLIIRPTVGSDSANRGKLPAVFQRVCGIQHWIHGSKFVPIRLCADVFHLIYVSLHNSMLCAQSSLIMYSLIIVKNLNESFLPSFCFRVKAPQWRTDKLHWAVKCPQKMPEDSSAITAWPLGHMFSCSVIPFVFPAKLGRIFHVDTVQKGCEIFI